MNRPRRRRRGLTPVAVAAVAGLVVIQGVGVGARSGHATERPVGVRALDVLSPEVSNGSALPTPSQCLAQLGFRCYTPALVAKAYDVDALWAGGVDGRGETIALIDPFGSPTIAADLAAFDRQFGLPDPPHFQVIQPVGAVPPFDPNDPVRQSWAGETTVDVEWSHAMAPGANILLVETPVDETEGVQGIPEIVAAENYVVNHHLADIISQSFGTPEPTFSSPSTILGLRSAFENAAAQGVTVLAGAGDTGATGPELDQTDLFTSPVVLWPSSDPLVTSVGGTELALDDSGHRVTPDAVWNDQFGATGGGVSTVFEEPWFQYQRATITGARRGTPDVSMAASPVWIKESYPPLLPGWTVATGTSVSTPLFAGIVAMADQLAGRSLGDINPALYRLPAPDFVDITVGNNSFGPFTNSAGDTFTVTGYSAGPGYDLASGLGTIDAARFVPALAAAH